MVERNYVHCTHPTICCFISFCRLKQNNSQWDNGRTKIRPWHSSQHVLFYFVLQIETEQQIVEECFKKTTSLALIPPFVILFRSANRSRATNGGIMSKQSNIHCTHPTVCCFISISKSKQRSECWDTGRTKLRPLHSAHHFLFYVGLQIETKQQMVG